MVCLVTEGVSRRRDAHYIHITLFQNQLGTRYFSLSNPKFISKPSQGRVEDRL
jgi:hypothetical protein